MRRPEAVQILQAKLADIEEEHQAELSASEGLREQIDARAEARALTAVFDFLQNCKIAPSESLLRILGAICVHLCSDFGSIGDPKIAGLLKGSGR